MSPEQTYRERVVAVSVIALIVLLYTAPPLVSLIRGPVPLIEPSEARYAEIGREMALSGDWLTPRLNGIKHFHKPPLTYWLTAISIRIFGANEWGARAPLLFASLGTVWFTFLLARSVYGRTAGLLAALVLASAFGFQVLSRILATDAYLVFFCAGAFCCSWRFMTSGRRLPLLGFYLFLALGFLTKGPVGLLYPLVPALVADAALRRHGGLAPGRRWFWHLLGLVLLALVALPWYILACRANPGLLAYLLGKGMGPVASARGMHGGPIYSYLLVLLGGFFPWSLLLPQAVGQAFRPGRGGWDSRGAGPGSTAPRPVGRPGAEPRPAGLDTSGFRTTGLRRTGPEAGRRRAASLYLATASFGWVGFFTALPAKLPAYILPTFIPLAVLLGNWLAVVLARRDGAEQQASAAAAAGGAGNYGRKGLGASAWFVLAMAVVLWFGLRLEGAGHLRDILHRYQLVAVAACVALAGGSWYLGRRDRLRGQLTLLALAPVAIYLLICWALPVTPGSRACPRELVEAVRRQAPHTVRLVNLRMFVKSLPFYTGKRVVLVDFPREIQFEEGYAEPPAPYPPAVRDYYFFGPRSARRLLHEPERSLWVTEEMHFDYVLGIKRDVDEILRVDGWVLFANRIDPATERLPAVGSEAAD